MRTVALAALTATIASACSNGGSSPPVPRREVKAYDGPDVVAKQRNPLGSKWDWAQIDTLSPYLASTTGGTTFFEFSWCDVEATQRVRDWSAVDRAVDSATRLGYRIDLKIRVGSCWATGETDPANNQHRTASSMPKDLFRYSNFISEAVTRYAAKGVGDFAFENEVNARNFWRGNSLDYRRLMEIAARAAHKANPDVRVFDAGLSSVAWGVIVADELWAKGDRKAAVTFYQRFYARRQSPGSVYPPVASEADLRRELDSDPARRAREYFAATSQLVRDGIVDAVQLHYYDPWEELPQVMAAVRARVGSAIAVEAWEVGVAWPGSDYDVNAHAHETLQLFATLLNEGVRRAMYLPVSFSPGRGRTAEVVRPLVGFEDATPNAAGQAFAALVAAAQGATRWLRISKDGLSGVAFDHGDTTTMVVWSKTKDPRIVTSHRSVEDVVANPGAV